VRVPSGGRGHPHSLSSGTSVAAQPLSCATQSKSTPPPGRVTANLDQRAEDTAALAISHTRSRRSASTRRRAQPASRHRPRASSPLTVRRPRVMTRLEVLRRHYAPSRAALLSPRDRLARVGVRRRCHPTWPAARDLPRARVLSDADVGRSVSAGIQQECEQPPESPDKKGPLFHAADRSCNASSCAHASLGGPGWSVSPWTKSRSQARHAVVGDGSGMFPDFRAAALHGMS
jgi:hypothetical protein